MIIVMGRLFIKPVQWAPLAIRAGGIFTWRNFEMLQFKIKVNDYPSIILLLADVVYNVKITQNHLGLSKY